MSIARDDIGSSGAIDALRTEFIKPGTLEKKEEVQKISGTENEPEINDVFEKKSNVNEKSVEKLQEDYNVLEVQKQVLNKIDERIERSETQEEPEISEEELVELEKQVEAILPEETKDVPEQEPPEEVRAEEPVNEQDSEAVEQRREAEQQIKELKAQVSEKQQQIANLQQKLYNEVSSVVELKIGKSSDTEETLEQKAEELKQSVVDAISEEPAKSPEFHITNLDKNMLLAMISLRR